MSECTCPLCQGKGLIAIKCPVCKEKGTVDMSAPKQSGPPKGKIKINEKITTAMTDVRTGEEDKQETGKVLTFKKQSEITGP